MTTTLPANQLLSEALDLLSLSRDEQDDALQKIEHLLASIMAGQSPTSLPEFLILQDTFEHNIAIRVVPWLAGTERAVREGAELSQSIFRQLSQSLSILQGLALLHEATKKYLGRPGPLQLLLDLLTRTKHWPNHGSSQPPPTELSGLALGIIDTLLCIMVDSPDAIRAFEAVNGIEVVVKILKRSGSAKDVRMKCLEFLYFYLLDETSSRGVEDGMHDLHSPNTPMPKTPPNKHSLLGPLLQTPTLISPGSSSFPSAPSTPLPATPGGPLGSPKKPTKSLGMLRNDVDFMPMTPKKPATQRGLRESPRKSQRTIPIPPPIQTSHRNSASQDALVEIEQRGSIRVSHAHGTRSTQEKKAILGTLVGNVEVLVEGVQRAGIFGLG
ncbi:hypothetical protein SISNIDRAFT_546875 [Sistotremastrum niveocremeum HHB9708]|uniref:CDC14-domain-containing protein n=1 Tax=Sistotremastrum niveocremeum HHB9708 TaxID=1314777 RepID=A0A164ZL60_9AGAM|nr:hypothetical protein SISNIDRAFT_546875 [Sistotremastrum niveocremeum HHB9708]